MSDTPRTDAAAGVCADESYGLAGCSCVSAEFARQLERDLAAALTLYRAEYNLHSDAERRWLDAEEKLKAHSPEANAPTGYLEGHKYYGFQFIDGGRETAIKFADRMLAELETDLGVHHDEPFLRMSRLRLRELGNAIRGLLPQKMPE